MKLEIKELSGSFMFNIILESISESSILLRLSRSAKRSKIWLETFFSQDINSQLIIHKNKNKKFGLFISHN